MYRAVRVKTRKPTFRVPTPDRKFGWVFWQLGNRPDILPEREKNPSRWMNGLYCMLLQTIGSCVLRKPSTLLDV